MDTMETEGSPLAPTRSLLATPLCRSAQSTEFRAAEDGESPRLAGHFAVFNTLTEIRSSYEGHFLERIAPGAFKKTFAERGDRIRVLFQHGRDPQVGSKPLGTIRSMSEDKVGAAYEVDLFDAGYVNDLLPGLRAGQYGASFQFIATREEWEYGPEPSAENPDGLDVRTVLEARLIEFGPVTFGAYPEATSGLRSLTDDYLVQALGGPDEIRALADKLEARDASPPVVDAVQALRREQEAAAEALLATEQERAAHAAAAVAAAERATELPATPAEETKPTTPAPSTHAATKAPASERREDTAQAVRPLRFTTALTKKETPSWLI